MSAAVAPLKHVALQQILVATDFSACAQAALSYGLALSSRYGSYLHILHVIPPSPFVDDALVTDAQLFAARQKMNDTLKSARWVSMTHEELIEKGDVCSVLWDVVQRCGIDLIVIGTHGCTRSNTRTLGALAAEIFRLAPVPVLTVAPHLAADDRRDEVKHVLCAIEFGPESADALSYALSLAEANDAELTLLHVAPELGVLADEPFVEARPPFDPKKVFAEMQWQLRELAAARAVVEHELEYLVEFGVPAETIIRTATEQRVDMLVVGTCRPKLASSHLCLSTAYNMACKAPCPVLSVASAAGRSACESALRR